MTSATERRRQLGRRPTREPSTSSRFAYHRRDRTDVEGRARAYAAGGGDSFIESAIQTYTPAKGDNWLRILPPTWKDPKHYGHDVYVHYGIGPDRQAYLCSEKGGRGECPICEERTTLARKGLTDSAAELRPTYRIAVYTIDRRAPDKGPLCWLMPYRIDQELVTASQDKRTGEVLWIDDPEAGYDIEFNRSGEGLHTQYTGVRIGRNPSPLGIPEALDFVQAHPLPDIFIYRERETIEKALAGTALAPNEKAENRSNAESTAASTVSPPRAQPTPSADAQLDEALRAADTYNIDIPDKVSDEAVPAFVAGELGSHLSEYPALSAC